MGSIGKAAGAIQGFMLAGPPGAQVGAKAGEDIGGSVGNLIGLKQGETGGLQGIQDAALGMYGEASGEYANQKDNRAAFGNQLANRAIGNAPSLAEAQMKAAQERNLKQQIAAVKANRSVSPALALRNTQRLGAEGAQQIAQASGVAKLQESNLNQQAYQNYLNNVQNSRFSALGAGAGAGQALAASSAANAASQNQFMGNLLGTGASLGAAAMMSDRNNKTKITRESALKKPAAMSDENQKVDVLRVEAPAEAFDSVYRKMAPENSTEGQGKKQGAAGLLSKLKNQKNMSPDLSAQPAGPVPEAGQNPEMLATVGMDQGTLLTKPSGIVVLEPEQAKQFAKTQQQNSFQMALSDRNKKSKVSEDPKNFSPQSFLDALKAYSYEYKDDSLPGTAPGRRLGVMAQDLEKAGPVGKSMVKETPDGKMVDYGQGFGAILAAQAHLNERLKNIESNYGKKA